MSHAGANPIEPAKSPQFGALLWSGLLRDARLRAVLPWNR